MTQDDIYGEPRQCQAIYPTGPCKAAGRVQVIARDYCAEKIERLSFCFDCAYSAVEDGQFEVDLCDI